MDLAQIEKIKKLAIIAIVSDDYLMEQLVLKGGNAINLVYKISGRASMDLDFSMPGDFEEEQMDSIQSKLERLLRDTFQQEELVVFDIKLIKKPDNIKQPDMMRFWGGYQINFKVVPQSVYDSYSDNIESLRKYSTVIGPKDRRVFTIAISKFEYCDDKVAKDIDGYTVYVYTTEMIAIEKIRAICQQQPEYREIVQRHTPNPRARDFFDIYTITQSYPMDFNSFRIKELLITCFKSKKVPLNLIRKVNSQREFHRTDYPSLRDTVNSDVDLRGFDFYFDFVVAILNSITI